MEATIQDKLSAKIQEIFPRAEVKKINKDNYLDIHIPSINSKRGTHLFFNTAKGEIKTGFFCRDEGFIQAVLAKEKTINAYSQGLIPIGNKSSATVEEAISAALDFISKISGSHSPSQKNVIETSDKKEKSNVLVAEESGLKMDASLNIPPSKDLSLEISEEVTKISSPTQRKKEAVEAPIIASSSENVKSVPDKAIPQASASIEFPFNDEKVKKVKTFTSAEKQQFLASVKENIYAVLVPELMVQLNAKGISIQELKRTFDKFPYLQLLPSILDNKIDDLNQKLFRGEIKLGQELFFFLEHYKKTKITNKSVTKNGEKIELTCYAQSKSMDKEIVALICKFEDEKLVSFEDKRDKVEKYSLYQAANSVEQFHSVCNLTETETLQCIQLNGLVKEIGEKKVVDLILKSPNIKCYSSTMKSKFDILIQMGVADQIEQASSLFDIILKDYPLNQFLKKLDNLDSSLIDLIPIKKLVELFTDLLIGQLRLAKKKFVETTKKPTGYVLDGSSVLVEQIPKNSIYDKKDGLKNLVKYTVELEKEYYSGSKYKEKTTVYSLNDITDIFLGEAKKFLLQIENLSSKGISKEEAKAFQDKINVELDLFFEVKTKSKAKAESFAVANKKEKKSNLFIVLGLVVVVIFLLYQCS